MRELAHVVLWDISYNGRLFSLDRAREPHATCPARVCIPICMLRFLEALVSSSDLKLLVQDTCNGAHPNRQITALRVIASWAANYDSHRVL
jgi:hypothetical protein